MKWANLKDFKCPNCAHLLEETPISERYICLGCNFKIGKIRFNEIVGDKYKNQKPVGSQDPERNLSDLNNLEL